MANEKSQQVFDTYGHVPARFDAIGGFRPTDGHSCYIVFADNKNSDNKNSNELKFVVFVVGYKNAWEEARRQLRIGKRLLPIDPEFNDDGDVINGHVVEPGLFKVRAIFSLDRKPRRDNGVSGKQLLDTAVQRGIGFNPKLRELLEELENELSSNGGDQRDAA